MQTLQRMRLCTGFLETWMFVPDLQHEQCGNNLISLVILRAPEELISGV